MSTLTGLFFKGLAALLPMAVTIGLLAWLGTSSEQLFAGLLKPYLGDHYIPGIGIVITVVMVFITGILMQAYLIRRLVQLGEMIMKRIPIVRTIYTSVQDLMDFIQRTNQRQGKQVVMVDIPLGDYKAQVMGFITRDEYEGLPAGIGGTDMVSVYMPMSYQIGGYTLTIPRDRVTPVDLTIEQGMRYAVTGGLTTSGMESLDADGQATKPNSSASTTR